LETPLSASIQLDVSLRPEAVKITGNALFRGQYGYKEVSCFSCIRANIVKKKLTAPIIFFCTHENEYNVGALQQTKCLFLSKYYKIILNVGVRFLPCPGSFGRF
jgi:hypothetical protein